MLLPSQNEESEQQISKTGAAEHAFDAGETGQAPPEGAETLRVRVGKIRIEGEFFELAAAGAALKKRLANATLSVADIFAAAQALEQSYFRAGYLLVRVTVPPQNLEPGGELVLSVIDGHFERIETKDVPPAVRRAVQAYTRSLARRGHVRLADVERAVLNAGNLPGLQLRSALKQGTEIGGTVLVLEGGHKAADFTTGIDNNLARDVGTWESTNQFSLNSALGFGEKIYASYNSDLGHAGRVRGSSRSGGGGIVIPLGPSGLTMNPDYVFAATAKPQMGGTEDRFERQALRFSTPLLLERNRQVNLNLGIDHIRHTVHLTSFNNVLNNDVYTDFHIGLDWSRSLDSGAFMQAGLDYTRGLGGRDGQDAKRTGTALSRQGADPVFDKLNASLQYSGPLPNRFWFNLSARAQATFGQAMFTSEQFALDTERGLSAFPDSGINVDEGATIRAEIGKSVDLTGPFSATSLTPYVFSAAGWGRRNRPTALEAGTVRAGSAGFGLRMNFAGWKQTDNGLELEIARRISDEPDARAQTRIGFKYTVRF